MNRLPFKHNVEKKHFEKWTPNRDLANFIHPYRMLITGPPNSGKSSTAMSIIARADPIWDDIILIHAKYFENELEAGDNKNIEIPTAEIKIPEYADIEFTCCLKTIPSGYTFFNKYQNKDNSKKNLLIIDDLDLVSWSQGRKDRKSALNKLFSYQSTHHGLTILVLAQCITTQLNPIIRRECNIFIIFKGRDRNVIQYFASGIGFPKKVLIKLFDLCSNNHQSICFDQTDETPAAIRLDIINPIELVKEKKE